MTINLTQKFLFETDDKSSLMSMLDCSIRVIFHDEIKRDTELTIMDDISEDYFDDGRRLLKVKGTDYNDQSEYSLPSRIHLLSITHGYMQKYRKNSHLKNIENIIRCAYSKMELCDEKDLFDKCGDGYYYGFNEYDGSIDVGYQLELGNSDILHLSMVHIYYGK